MIDLPAARETFEGSADFTVGIEEEFALARPRDAAARPPLRACCATRAAAIRCSPTSIAGELISSEIEIRSGARRGLRGRPRAPGGGPPPAVRARPRARCRARRHRHPPAQRLPRAAHHRHGALPPRRGRPEVRRLAQQHVLAPRPRRRAGRRPRGPGVRPAAPRPAAAARRVSANSPYVDGRDSGLHSARTQIFTKSFPRCGIPDAFGSWQAWSDYVELLVRTGSIVEFTQLWWSVRPHHAFGTVEVRICDAQMTAEEADGARRADRRAACAERRARGRRRARRRRTFRAG